MFQRLLLEWSHTSVPTRFCIVIFLVHLCQNKEFSSNEKEVWVTIIRNTLLWCIFFFCLEEA